MWSSKDHYLRVFTSFKGDAARGSDWDSVLRKATCSLRLYAKCSVFPGKGFVAFTLSKIPMTKIDQNKHTNKKLPPRT